MNYLISLYSYQNDGNARNEKEKPKSRLTHCAGLNLKEMHSHSKRTGKPERKRKKREKVSDTQLTNRHSRSISSIQKSE